MPTAESTEETLLRERLGRCPALRSFLAKLCDCWDREGLPPQRLTLSTELTGQGALTELHAVFGAAALRSSRQGLPQAVDVAGFLRGQDAAAVAAWRALLCRVLDRPLRDRRSERRCSAAIFAELLAAWRLAHPVVASAAAVLEVRAEGWQQRLALGEAGAVAAAWARWGQALAFLSQRSELVGLAEVGARFYGDSKALRTGEARSLLAAGLAALEELDEQQVEPGALFQRFGICDNPTALQVTVFGPVRLRKQGRWLDWIEQLHALGESATLTLGNLAGVDAVEVAGKPGVVHTSENETPFCRLVRERFPGVVVYTEGYPNAAVRRWLGLLAPAMVIHHWGDSDLDGLRIADILARDRPLELWRCALADLQGQRARLVPLAAEPVARAQRWLAAWPEFRFRAELEFTLAHGWLEQESWLER